MRLEGTGITAGYGAQNVLETVDVAVETGEFVGLIGPNGSGKSTLLRVLSQALRPRRGQVRLEGREIGSWSSRELARRLAFVPQEEPAVFDFTVRDVVLMGRHPHHRRFQGDTAEDYACVARALADADILHLADRPITQLSGGEHRRVLLARALAQQTPFLLLDEPTAHLDVTHQIEILALVHRLTRERGVGALAALHDLNHAAEFCDRLTLLCAGRRIAEGLPEAVLTPVNLRAAYDAHVQVGRNPATGKPMLLSLYPARAEAALPDAPRIHVVCGGGSGVGVMGALVRNGFRVTAGVLNRLDSDQEAAEALGIEIALEAPFSPIGPAARAACRALMARAQTILVAPVAFGRGNLANLELAVEAQAAGKPILLLGEAPFAARDYTGGTATHLLEQLAANGALRYERLEDWPALTHLPSPDAGQPAEPSPTCAG
ncbi:MAG TPA: heme ABC transporter ATP-binding protein [Chthonomonadaceae bacterium]|nr:heme ABC transporter ATP-binding protein [Chthonomonadaceae bacterium]